MNLRQSLDPTLRAHLQWDVSWNQVLDAAGLASSRRRPRSLVCSCPFHGEKRTSLIASNATGRFHCHGCNAEGDRVDFVIRFWKIRLEEVLVARFLLIENPDNDPQQRLAFNDPGAPAPATPQGNPRRSK